MKLHKFSKYYLVSLLSIKKYYTVFAVTPATTQQDHCVKGRIRTQICDYNSSVPIAVSLLSLYHEFYSMFFSDRHGNG